MLYAITKQGCWGQINPIPDGKLRAMLKKKMSYVKLGAEFMPNPAWATVHLYKKDKGLFPWGFRVLVRKIFDEWHKYSGDIFEMPELVLKVDDINWHDKELRYYQKEAVVNLIENAGMVSMPCRSGKTRVAIEYIKQINKPALVVVTTLDLKQQWEQQVQDLPVIVKTYQSIKTKDKILLDNIAVVIFDECHHCSAKSLYNIAMHSPKALIVGLSATPYREDNEEMKIQAALGEIVYKISRKELVKQGFLSDAIVKYHHIAPDSYRYWENYQEAYKGYIVNNADRNNRICEATLDDYGNNKKVIILCSQIEHMEILRELLKPIEVLYINGKVKKKERIAIKEKILNAEKGLIIIASTVYDEGIDLPEINSVVLAAGGKSSIKLIQRSSRVLTKKIVPEKSIIHDFTDNCKWLFQHYKRRRALLEEDFEVVEIEQ